MLRFQTPRVVPKDHNAQVRFYLRSTIEDMMDFLRPARRWKSDSIIIHTGTINFTESINTMKQVRKIINAIKDVEGGRESNLRFSSIIRRTDGDFHDRIKDINDKWKRCCSNKDFLFINNDNISDRYLNRSLMHLNRTCNKLFLNNIVEVLPLIIFLLMIVVLSIP